MESRKPRLSAMDGLRLPLEGARLLARERSLWAPSVVPIGLSVLAIGLAVSLLVAYSSELYSWATLWTPILEAGEWYSWLWIGPAKVALGAIGAVLFAGIAAVSLLTAFLVANILASPFLDVLSYRVERIESGSVCEEGSTGLLGSATDVVRSLREEMRKTFFFLAVVGALSLIGLLIPGAQLLTGPAIIGFAIFFLPLDYASYALDRRRLTFREKRRWLGSNKPAVVGFGLAAFLTCTVPGLNLIALPLLVVGGTLLALRHELSNEPSTDL
jgi:CysZ protein